MYVDGKTATAVLNPGHKQTSARLGPTTNKPVAGALHVRHLVTLWVRHRFFHFLDRDLPLRVVMLDVLPVSAVPDDRPIVHS